MSSNVLCASFSASLRHCSCALSRRLRTDSSSRFAASSLHLPAAVAFGVERPLGLILALDSQTTKVGFFTCALHLRIVHRKPLLKTFVQSPESIQSSQKFPLTRGKSLFCLLAISCLYLEEGAQSEAKPLHAVPRRRSSMLLSCGSLRYAVETLDPQ